MTLIGELKLRGFVVVDEFLDKPTVRNLIAKVEALEPNARSSRVRRGAAFARRNLLELPFVHNLIAQAHVRELLDSIAPGLVAVRAILFDKTGPANWTVPWHQDRSIAVRERIDVPGFGPWSNKAGVIHVQPPVEILRRMVTLRFSLDPCGVDNGPLRVIDGTHDRILDQAEVELMAATSAQHACATATGGLVIMRPLVLHASSPATVASHRRVVHVEFGPPELPEPRRWAMA